MKEERNQDQKYLKVLANQFKVMSQKGTVGFYEETVLEGLAEYFWKQDDLKMALEVVNWGIQLYPYSSSMIYLKAQLLYKMKEYPAALIELEKAIALDPLDADCKLLKAKMLIEMERYEQASETLEGVKIDSVSITDECNVHLCYATIYENLDRHAEMFDSLCQAIRSDWDNEEIIERLGLCVEFSQRHDDHIAFLNEYLNERPYSAIAWFNLGHSYWVIKDYDNAIDSFEFAFCIDKYYQQAYIDCADVYIKKKEYQKGLSCYEEAMENCPQDGELYVGKGNCLYMMKENEKALIAYKEATLISPKNAEGYYGLGLCYMETEQGYYALESFKMACKLDKRREEFAAALGEAYYMIGDMHSATEAFNRSIELAPEMSEYWVRLITFLMDEERYEEALESINSAFLNTYGTELLYCHAAYCFRTGNRNEGMNHFNEAITENYTMHASFLDLCPDLGKDNEILSIIATHRPK